MAKDPEGNEIPVIQAPAVVLPPTPATPQAEVRAVIKEDAAIEERAKKAQGQRDISDTWEATQRLVALSVTFASLGAAVWLAVNGRNPDVEVASTVFLYGVANLVIGFYFGRTNHTKVGGSEGRDAS